RRVASTGVDGALDSVALDGITGATVVVLAGGSLTVSNAVGATGNLLLQATGATSDLSVQAAVGSSAGAISFNAGHDFTLGAPGSVLAGTGSIDLVAGGNVTLAAASTMRATAGQLRVLATGDAKITGITATAVQVVSSTGAILDNGDLARDITAGS